MNHKKHDARQDAADRITDRDHLSERPTIPGSDRDISQGRFAGETALTGEDRPSNEAGGKRHAHDADAVADHAATGPIPTHAGDAERPGGARQLPEDHGADYKR